MSVDFKSRCAINRRSGVRPNRAMLSSAAEYFDTIMGQLNDRYV